MIGGPANLAQILCSKADPIFSAWGLYGKDDQLGFLNRQTDAIVAEAAKEIETGDRWEQLDRNSNMVIVY